MSGRAQTLWDDMRLTLDEARALTVDSLRAHGAEHKHWGIAWSGGKDSTATLTLLLYLIDAGLAPQPETLTVWYADTRQELPPLYIAALSIIRSLTIRGVNVRRVVAPLDKRFLVYILSRGVPPPNNATFRWCTRQIKVDPMIAAIETDLPDDGSTVLMITGVRIGESAARDARIALSCGRDGAECGQGWYQEIVPNAAGVRGRVATLAPIDLIVTSIPFANHYEYTPLYNDLGHTDDNGHFLAQMDFLAPQLLRVLRPGRLACIHVKDRILFGNVTGAGLPTVSPFHAEAIFHYRRHGFDYLGMITVVTDVVRENNQTYRLGWSENAKDGTKMGVGSPEYVLILHKPQSDRTRSYADVPVAHPKPLCRTADGREVPFEKKLPPIPGTGYSRAAWQIDAHALWRSSGNRLLSAEELAGYPPNVLSKLFTQETLTAVYDYRRHVAIGEALEQRFALPSEFMSLAPGSHDPMVWHDVNRMRTLNGAQSLQGRELHVCPLQLDIIERLITRYSNPGETVMDPFGGIMSVPYSAIKLARSGIGIELHSDYWRDGIRHCDEAEREIATPSLFDIEAAAAELQEAAE